MNNSFDWESWDRYFQTNEVWKKDISQNKNQTKNQNRNQNRNQNHRQPESPSIRENPYNNSHKTNASPLLNSTKPDAWGKIKNPKKQTSSRRQPPPIPEKLGDMFQNKTLDKEGAVLLQCIQQMIETYVNKKK